MDILILRALRTSVGSVIRIVVLCWRWATLMSMGCWGNTCSHFKWVVGEVWRKQRKVMCIILQ